MKLIQQLLKEFDASDLALIKQHDDAKKGAAGSEKFSKSMEKSQAPSKGDIVMIKNTKFSVKSPTIKGIEIVELGAQRRTMTIPHTTNFVLDGENAIGKKIFKIRTS